MSLKVELNFYFAYGLVLETEKQRREDQVARDKAICLFPMALVYHKDKEFYYQWLAKA